MKKLMFPALFSLRVWRMAICALLIASATQSVAARESSSTKTGGAIFASSAADGGRLVIHRSPVLGANVAINLQIDGKQAGSLVRGSYERFLTPGSHTVTASANYSDAGRATLNVIPGKTYSYSVSYKVNKLVLTPTGPR